MSHACDGGGVCHKRAVMHELMDVCGGCPDPAHTALAYTIIVTGERYKLGARPASNTAVDGNVVGMYV